MLLNEGHFPEQYEFRSITTDMSVSTRCPDKFIRKPDVICSTLHVLKYSLIEHMSNVKELGVLFMTIALESGVLQDRYICNDRLSSLIIQSVGGCRQTTAEKSGRHIVF